MGGLHHLQRIAPLHKYPELRVSHGQVLNRLCGWEFAPLAARPCSLETSWRRSFQAGASPPAPRLPRHCSLCRHSFAALAAMGGLHHLQRIAPLHKYPELRVSHGQVLNRLCGWEFAPLAARPCSLETSWRLLHSFQAGPSPPAPQG